LAQSQIRLEYIFGEHALRLLDLFCLLIVPY
jgi:hypothetical protein